MTSSENGTTLTEFVRSSRPGYVILTEASRTAAKQVAHLGTTITRSQEERSIVNLLRLQIRESRLGELTERQALVVTVLIRRLERLNSTDRRAQDSWRKSESR